MVVTSELSITIPPVAQQPGAAGSLTFKPLPDWVGEAGLVTL